MFELPLQSRLLMTPQRAAPRPPSILLSPCGGHNRHLEERRLPRSAPALLLQRSLTGGVGGGRRAQCAAADRALGRLPLMRLRGMCHPSCTVRLPPRASDAAQIFRALNCEAPFQWGARNPLPVHFSWCRILRMCVRGGGADVNTAEPLFTK